MNSGSLAGSVAMKVGSMVRFLSTRWHVAQVRPLPANGSRKNRSAPTHVSTVTAPTTTRGSRAQAAARSSIVVDAAIAGPAVVPSTAVVDSPGTSGEGTASRAAPAGPTRTAVSENNV